jgi:alpha-beta hydrolase superfamily lysophospholipase
MQSISVVLFALIIACAATHLHHPPLEMLNFTLNGHQEWIQLYHVYKHPTDPIFILISGSGSDYRPIIMSPDGVLLSDYLAMNGIQFYAPLFRGMSSESSPLNGSLFGIESMTNDTEIAVDHILQMNPHAPGVVMFGDSLGGDVVIRYNSRHGVKRTLGMRNKLCGTIAQGGPYSSLALSFMPMLEQMASFPVDNLPVPLLFLNDTLALDSFAELENEMTNYDLEFNSELKHEMYEHTFLVPIGPFKVDFSNFSRIMYDWEHTDVDVPMLVMNGYDEKVIDLPSTIDGFAAMPSADKEMIIWGNGGHMVFWELAIYEKFRTVLINRAKRMISLCTYEV